MLQSTNLKALNTVLCSDRFSALQDKAAWALSEGKKP